ncbi:MAG: M13 family metallopeptidase [Candidatus Riflebacteria bacterium]|nr:M13 family metallopeptidase [Candidatus Riflebacteria bacterium]
MNSLPMHRLAMLASLLLLITVPTPGLSASPSPAASGGVFSGMDRSIAPGDDFFDHANGAWAKSTEIPPDRSSYGNGAMLTELTSKRTADLIRQAAQHNAPEGSEARMVGDFFASYMDEEAIESRGLDPLRPTLEEIAGISDRKKLATYLGGALRADVDALNSTDLYTDKLLGLWVAQDLDDPGRYAPFLLQGGLGMPDREYYLDSSRRMSETRAKYRAHIAAVLTLARLPDVEAKAARIFDLEHRIAKVHWTRLDSGDVARANNHWKRGELDVKAPGLDWQAFLVAAGLDRQPTFAVWQPGAVTGISALTASQPLRTWKDYLAVRAIEHHSGCLPRAFVQQRFQFYGQVLTGTPRLRDRWKRAVDATNEALPEAVGKLYVQSFFPASEKARAEAMVTNLVAAFGRRVDKLAWMAPATKARAKEKLAMLKVSVGYPEKWQDYSGMKVLRGDAFGNVHRAELFHYRRHLSKLGRPVDRTEWAMTPQMVNAVNLPAMNALNFPAAILQPPYFDPRRPEVMDYGAIGAIIGHEISHSFDDQGSLFDATGRLSNWWTREDLARFQAAAARLVKQYSAYRPFPDLSVNGQQTLGENIADLAGLEVAYDAYRLSLKGKPAPVVEGFTGDQQFFLSFAQAWRHKAREPARRQQIITDGHAPAAYRTSTVRNVDAWYEAFGVKAGQSLYLAPDARIRVW